MYLKIVAVIMEPAEIWLSNSPRYMFVHVTKHNTG